MYAVVARTINRQRRVDGYLYTSSTICFLGAIFTRTRVIVRQRTEKTNGGGGVGSDAFDSVIEWNMIIDCRAKLLLMIGSDRLRILRRGISSRL